MTFWLLALPIAFSAILLLAFIGASGALWTAAAALGLLLLSALALPGWLALLFWLAFLVAAALLNYAPLRRLSISDRLFTSFKALLPQVSATEQEALQAGTVWWDGDLFSGKPDWRKLLGYPKPQLSAEEQRFLDGPTEQLCAMLDDWKITHDLYDLPAHVWQFLKETGFFGMIIAKRYGGLEFSALAHSDVVLKISTRSNAAAVSVMVPNSLGPAELLSNYGTEEQKNLYLPRLAKGLDIPCFALTGPEAGSDAGSIPDSGIVCRGEFEGRADVLGIRLNWEKRYITLAPVATLLGLAFKLYDPDHMLGETRALGITLALIPTSTPGVRIGRRHFPLDGVFQNGPTWGSDVFIPLDWIIGGRARVGQGWRMLMECLAAGRSISLPAQSVAAGKLASRATGAYARVRKQFNTPIGRFEGVEEALARIGAYTYMMDAARVMTAGAVDLGERPAVPSAIVKYHLTERMRSVINDAMDVHGGKGICLGPSNYLGRAYQLIPVAITVEGANILTRSLIIFGQGAIRCHPYVLTEIAATQEPDAARASAAFDAALWGHIGFSVRNAARSFVLGLTGGRFIRAPGAGENRRFFQQLDRFAAAFALLADIAMLVVGGSLKRREKLSARLGDILSHLYLSSAALKRFEDQGRQQADLPLLHWSLYDSFFRIQVAMDGVLANFPNRIVAAFLRRLVFPKGLTLIAPTDAMGHAVSEILITPSQARDRLTSGIYLPNDESDSVGRLEFALDAVIAADPIESKVRTAQKAWASEGESASRIVARALEQGVITLRESESLRRAQELTRSVIMVDDFAPDFGKENANSLASEACGSDAPYVRKFALSTAPTRT